MPKDKHKNTISQVKINVVLTTAAFTGDVMGTEKLDPRAALAKMDAEEKAAKAALETMQKANADQKAEVLKELREADLADVKEKCKLHGFSQSDLRGVLKTRGAKKATATPRKSAAGKTAAKKRATKA